MLNKLPWSLMGTRVNPVSSIFGSAKPSFLDKPSYCVYHSKAAAYKSGAFIKYVGMCLNGSKIKHRNVRVVSKVQARPSKSHIFDRVMAHRRKSHILGGKISEYRKGCSMYALSLYGSTKSPLSSSRPSLRYPSKTIKPSGGFARRTFSVQSMPTSDLIGTGTTMPAFGKDGKGLCACLDWA